jgi:hypothetical protein
MESHTLELEQSGRVEGLHECRLGYGMGDFGHVAIHIATCDPILAEQDAIR